MWKYVVFGNGTYITQFSDHILSNRPELHPRECRAWVQFLFTFVHGKRASPVLLCSVLVS